MLPRLLLSRGGVATLQLQRFTISNPARTTIFRGVALTGGNGSSGNSVFSVRYGSSDSKDSDGKSKKNKKLKRKEWDLKDKRDDKDKDKKYKLKKDQKYQFKEKEKEKRERDEERDEEEEEEDHDETPKEANSGGETVMNVAKEDKHVPAGTVGRGGSAAIATPEPEASKVEHQSAVINDSNPSKPTSIAGEATREPRPSEPEESKVEQESAVVNPPLRSNLASVETVKVAPEDEIELSPRSEEVSQKTLNEEPPKGPNFSNAPDFYQLIASNSISYANPNHLGRNQQPPSTPPQGAFPSSPSFPSLPPSSPSPPSIPDAKHASQSTLTAFPTITITTPKPQPITFASTRLNTPVTAVREGSEKLSGKEQKEEMLVGGVKIPPKPEEPDNCCMSGCVNCVWDLYREELEHYTAQKLLAQQIQLQSQSSTPTLASTPSQTIFLSPKISPTPRLSPEVNTGMNTDGDRGVKSDEREWLENEDIPMGIRAFMATEKMLRERKKERESRL